MAHPIMRQPSSQQIKTCFRKKYLHCFMHRLLSCVGSSRRKPNSIRSMKTIATISMIQARIATGQDQSATTNIAVLCHTNDDLHLVDENDRKSDGYTTANGFRHLGNIEIKHPSIMAGSWEEVWADFHAAAIDKLEEMGWLCENDYGVKFVKDKILAAA